MIIKYHANFVLVEKCWSCLKNFIVKNSDRIMLNFCKYWIVISKQFLILHYKILKNDTQYSINSCIYSNNICDLL